jgi:drug/metabolite transporter (DMT)-like permease
MASLLQTHEGTHREAFTSQDWLFLAAPALIWGCSFLFIAEALESFSPALVAAGRIGFGALTLACVPVARRTRVDRQAWLRIAVLGVTWMSLPFACFSIAEQWIDSALAGMLNAVMPLTTAFVSALLLRRIPKRIQSVGLLIGFAGALLIALPEFDGGSAAVSGILLVLLAVLSYSISVNISIPLTQQYGSLPIIWRTQLAALVVSAPFAVPGLGSVDFHWSGFSALVLLGVGGTALAQVFAARLIARVGATRGSMITYLMPIVSIAVGVAFRDESVAALSLFGIVVVLLGATVASRAEI